MSDIQRWEPGVYDSEPPMIPDTDGVYVTYADHLAAVQQAEQTGYFNGQCSTQRYHHGDAFDKAYEQGQRDIFALHTEWTVTGMCKPGCLPCQRLDELIAERSAGYKEGQRDAIAAAVRRVKDLGTRDLTSASHIWGRNSVLTAVIAAIKGESS